MLTNASTVASLHCVDFSLPLMLPPIHSGVEGLKIGNSDATLRVLAILGSHRLCERKQILYLGLTPNDLVHSKLDYWLCDLKLLGNGHQWVFSFRNHNWLPLAGEAQPSEWCLTTRQCYFFFFRDYKWAWSVASHLENKRSKSLWPACKPTRTACSFICAAFVLHVLHRWQKSWWRQC